MLLAAVLLATASPRVECEGGKNGRPGSQQDRQTQTQSGEPKHLQIQPSPLHDTRLVAPPPRLLFPAPSPPPTPSLSIVDCSLVQQSRGLLILSACCTARPSRIPSSSLRSSQESESWISFPTSSPPFAHLYHTLSGPTASLPPPSARHMTAIGSAALETRSVKPLRHAVNQNNTPARPPRASLQ